MKRRDFVTRASGIALGSVLASGTVAGRDGGSSPNGNVRTETVSIFAPEDDPRQVSTGSWISHSWGWFDGEGGDSTREDLERWLDAVELTVLIDGEEVENPDQYLGEIFLNDDGKYQIDWEYVTPPKSPGRYTFTVEYYYPDGFEDVSDEDEEGPDIEHPPGFRQAWTGHYEVTGGRGK